MRLKDGRDQPADEIDGYDAQPQKQVHSEEHVVYNLIHGHARRFLQCKLSIFVSIVYLVDSSQMR